MKNQLIQNEYDVIIVGSGTCGATIAKELCKKNKSVLILERGKNNPLKESVFNLIATADVVSVGEKMATMRGITTGGSTALYFAVADKPPFEVFQSLGVDLKSAFNEVKDEIQMAPLPDELISEQTLKLRDSAMELGYTWKKKMMLVDQTKCDSGYSYDAKWKAKPYVDEAVGLGATLINRATVEKVIIENNRAIGVEFKLKRKAKRKVYGSKIILAAGSAATPLILRNSGMKEIEENGFYIDPNFALFGTVSDLNGGANFMGCISSDYEDDILIGDLNTTPLLFRMMMLANFKLTRLFSFKKTIGIGVKVKDSLSGEITEKGDFNKKLTKEEYDKLKKGEEKAMEILKNTGAKNIFHSGYGATSLGGTLKINKHVNADLQTEYDNLYVCDGSLIPENVRISPAVTLVCLGKYLTKHLAA